MPIEEECIKHLSTEIETHTNAMMTYRTRIAFIVFLGPFVLFSSVLVGIQRVPKLELTSPTILALAGLALCYVGLGVLSARIEGRIWEQCNQWRRMIASIGPPPNPMPPGIAFSNRFLGLVYGLAYMFLFFAFCAMVFLITNLFRDQGSP